MSNNLEIYSIDVIGKILDINLNTEQKIDKKLQLHQAILSGLSYSSFDSIQKELNISQMNLASILGISQRTIARRRENNHLNALESEILYRVARVLAYTVTVFGDIEKARVWLKRPNRGLGGEIPLNLLGSDMCSQQVEDVLHRINYGIYS